MFVARSFASITLINKGSDVGFGGKPGNFNWTRHRAHRFDKQEIDTENERFKSDIDKKIETEIKIIHVAKQVLEQFWSRI